MLGGLVALAAVARRALRRPPDWEAPPLGHAGPLPEIESEGAAEPPGAAPAAEPPSGPKAPSAAAPSDREAESRLDDETKYDRSREKEESARHETAERLRHDPLVEPRDARP